MPNTYKYVAKKALREVILASCKIFNVKPCPICQLKLLTLTLEYRATCSETETEDRCLKNGSLESYSVFDRWTGNASSNLEKVSLSL